MAEIKKRLAFSILQFLQQSIKDGTIIEEDKKEGIDVAGTNFVVCCRRDRVFEDLTKECISSVQCISEAFDVNLEDPEQKELYSTRAPLLSIFEVAVKAQERVSKPQQSSARSVPQSVVETKIELSEEQKQKAEELKGAGNRKVAEKDYKAAIQLYDEAISINGNNAVYYANRAAAYSQLGQHDKAIEDATKSSQIDPSYSKSYSRLGHAYFSIGKYNEAVEAYEKGLSLDPNNSTMKSALDAAKQRINETSVDNLSDRGTRGGAPGTSLMNNPALMSMANQMMQSGALSDIMNNPNIAEMAQNMMRGGNPPNVDELMNNPELVNLARQFANNRGSDGNPSNEETQ
ncbi:12337_t:CDS:10 [Acaulospora morrowiae]|uniref:12337_t:CDS:1 n=1 Tax=Acaulospora morrowiae TaxID=94023 RepID=A0A9N8V5S1_9GLOM|nr:12337_t:CDS:10 [Acaulospora morrowiae]